MGFRQEECRPGACCLWFVALLHVPGSWSSCVFSCVHRCCFLECCFHLSKDPLGVKLSPVLACSTSGSGRGFRSRLLARVLPGVGAGSEARGEGRLFLRMRLRLLYSVCVVICWGRARRAPRSGPSYDDRWFLRRYQGGSCSCS